MDRFRYDKFGESVNEFEFLVSFIGRGSSSICNVRITVNCPSGQGLNLEAFQLRLSLFLVAIGFFINRIT